MEGLVMTWKIKFAAGATFALAGLTLTGIAIAGAGAELTTLLADAGAIGAAVLAIAGALAVDDASSGARSPMNWAVFITVGMVLAGAAAGTAAVAVWAAAVGAYLLAISVILAALGGALAGSSIGHCPNFARFLGIARRY
jgi:hypothetical protein